jgi:hypothetical protein
MMRDESPADLTDMGYWRSVGGIKQFVPLLDAFKPPPEPSDFIQCGHEPCQEMFAPETRWQAYCSKRCKAAAEYVRRKSRRAAA